MIDEKNMALVVVLYIIGMMIKNANTINDKYIPLILGAVGIVLSIPFNFSDGIINAIIKGILCAGMSVYGNQIYKQLEKK